MLCPYGFLSHYGLTPLLYALVAMVAFIRDTAQAPARPAGFTLLEILVVLILIGIGFTLAIPAFIRPRRDAEHGVQHVIDSARRMAVRRAETLTVSIQPSGTWAVDNGDRDTEPATGTVESDFTSVVRVRISALGACTLDSIEPGVTVDAVSCRIERRVRS
ncbi:MAG: prepilin-type N-terminal cleavage/methylation domain-containing protein [Gemmatimonadota bacterium]